MTDLKSYTDGWNNALDLVMQRIDESKCLDKIHKNNPCKNHPKIINADKFKKYLKKEMRE